MNIEVTQKADGWMLGTIEGGYEWQAKVYEKPSEFGINGGRVSKLFIRPVGLGWQPTLISYDRGWDKRPETQDAKVVFETLLNYLESTTNKNSERNMDMNEKTIEDALNLLISGELDLVDTALGEVSNIKTYAEAGILTRDSGLVLRMEDGSEFQITIKQSK